MRNLLVGVLACAATLLAGAAFAQGVPATTPVLADLIAPPQILSMTLSPDGKQAAAIGFHDKVTGLFVVDVETGHLALIREPERTAAGFPRMPRQAFWVKSGLLAVNFSDGSAESLDTNGKKIAYLGEWVRRPIRTFDSDSDWVLAYRDYADGELEQVNAVTGERRRVSVKLPGKAIERVFDTQGVLRAVTMRDTAFWSGTSRVANWYRSNADSPWELLEEGSIVDDYWVPMAITEDSKSLVVAARHERDTLAIFRYDPATHRFADMMAGHPSEDIASIEEARDGSYVGVITSGMKTQHYWFDADWSRIQAAVDAALPGSINTLRDRGGDRVLVGSNSDVDPGRWFVLDTKTNRLREIGVARPGVDPAAMRPMQIISYAARDGMAIHAYLTMPKAQPGALPPPLIVLIHGGPHERDTWGWNEEVQVLATRGYAVLQPQFRGSRGFGRKYEEAGYRQWGKAMQDDITDGVRDLTARGIVDPQRVCIQGSSYGGYAALWGLIKSPELYKCGVSFAGVTNLAVLVNRVDRTDDDARWLRRHIGDPAQDKRELEWVSPVLHADRIKVPVLLVHGERDRVVPPSHGRNMLEALRDDRKQVEWLALNHAGHGIFLPSERTTYYTTLLDFLDRMIGSRAAK
jgi:dipeptidyl aminopeptidase/acylaminoacyl peptidase